MKNFDRRITIEEVAPQGKFFIFRSSFFIYLQVFIARHHTTVKQMHCAVGKGSIVLRVGHHDDGSAFAVQFAQQFDDLGTVLRVEVTGRLVGQYQFRIGHYSTGNGYTLLLSAR